MDDLISRQAALNILNVGTELLRRALDDADLIGVEREKCEWGLGLIESYISDIKDLPSAQPERKKGRWISDEDGNIYCSVCGRTGVGESFCEHCGANMKGEEE